MVGSLVPCKASCEPSTLRCLPATCVPSQLCHCPRQSGRTPGPEHASCPYGKQKVNKTEVKVDSVFRLFSYRNGFVVLSIQKKNLFQYASLTSVTVSLIHFLPIDFCPR